MVTEINGGIITFISAELIILPNHLQDRVIGFQKTTLSWVFICHIAEHRIHGRPYVQNPMDEINNISTNFNYEPLDFVLIYIDTAPAVPVN